MTDDFLLLGINCGFLSQSFRKRIPIGLIFVYESCYFVAYVLQNDVKSVYLRKMIIMKQTATTIRIDADLKAAFDKLCDEFGMSANTAFNIYVKAVVRQRRIPFQIEADPIDDVMEQGRRAFYEMRRTARENGTAGMSLEEINEEIRTARRGE